jgi:hypothetical protein
VGTTAFGGGDFTVWGWTKVVALLPPVADSLALYGLCGLALPSIRIGRRANG